MAPHYKFLYKKKHYTLPFLYCLGTILVLRGTIGTIGTLSSIMVDFLILGDILAGDSENY